MRIDGSTTIDATCTKWKTCEAGTKRIDGNKTADATCINCEDGTYQPLNNFNGTSCIDWKVCSAGEKRRNGNTIVDASCTACDKGQYQPANEFAGTKCIDWTPCFKYEFISKKGTIIQDQICRHNRYKTDIPDHIMYFYILQPICLIIYFLISCYYKLSNPPKVDGDEDEK